MGKNSITEPNLEDGIFRGCPHDGQTPHAPIDQDDVLFFDDAKPRRYLRLVNTHEFHHQGHIDALIGGRR